MSCQPSGLYRRLGNAPTAWPPGRQYTGTCWPGCWPAGGAGGDW